MASKSVAFIAGIVFMASFRQDQLCSTQDVEKGCVITRHDTTVWCSNISFHEIPTNLSAKTRDLTVVNSFLKQEAIKADSFKPYPNLTRLEIRRIRVHLGTTMEFHENAFSSLLHLHRLILDSIPFNSNTNADYQWPIDLRRLELSNISLKRLDNTKRLGGLIELKVESTEMQSFPELNVTAPLETIILEENPIRDIQVSQIASFCLLQTFQFNFKINRNITDHFLSFNKSCVCLRLENWLRKRSIPITFSCAIDGHGNIQCPNAKSFEAEDAMYRACTNRQQGSSIWELLLYAVFFSILFPIGYFLNETINRFTSPGETEHAEHPDTQVFRRNRRECRKDSSSVDSDEEECDDEIDSSDE